MVDVKLNIVVPTFQEYCIPNGWLPRENGAHALFYYALIARSNYEESIDEFQYEGDPDKVFDNRAVFKNVAFLYGVTTEEMVNYWTAVRMQFNKLNIPLPPESFMFKNIPNIILAS